MSEHPNEDAPQNQTSSRHKNKRGKKRNLTLFCIGLAGSAGLVLRARLKQQQKKQQHRQTQQQRVGVKEER